MVAASDRVFDLLVLPGDGIGPEIIGETLRVADWFGRNAGLRLNLTEGLAGGASIDAVGAPVSEAVVRLPLAQPVVLMFACSTRGETVNESP